MGLESCSERSGWLLKPERMARRLFSAKYTSILDGFIPQVWMMMPSNRDQMSRFIGGSKLEFLCSFSFLRHQSFNQVTSPSASF